MEGIKGQSPLIGSLLPQWVLGLRLTLRLARQMVPLADQLFGLGMLLNKQKLVGTGP